MKPITERRESLAERVYEQIRNAIIMGELAPDSKHSVSELASVLQVSRTPVREALLKLADQGMVRFHRNVGVVVLPTTIHDLEEVFSVRLLLEVPATFRAVSLMTAADIRELRRALDDLKETASAANPLTREYLERDARFHRIILRASGNRRLTSFVDSLRDIQMVRGATTIGKTQDPMSVWSEHEAIFQRVKARDPLGAARMMAQHIAGTAKLLLGQEMGADTSDSGLGLPWTQIFELFVLEQSRESSLSADRTA